MAFCGRIISAGPGDPRECPGRHLVSRGTISGEQFAEAFEEQKKTNVLPGKVLVLRGAVFPGDLMTVFRMVAIQPPGSWGEGR